MRLSLFYHHRSFIFIKALIIHIYTMQMHNFNSWLLRRNRHSVVAVSCFGTNVNYQKFFTAPMEKSPRAALSARAEEKPVE